VISSERAAAPARDTSVRSTAERLSRALGPKYQVKRLVGRGGFAEVYELWDVDLDRRLACKVLLPEIAWTPGMIARFRQEAKALARLHHPAILPIHFAGDGEGLVYYVMPFIEGESLAEALRRRQMFSVSECLQIVDPILRALEHAHAQGLVHRDIKPDNVMLEAKTARAILLDFGIAKLLDPADGATKTATGFTVGTVQYMSPEQALGQADLDGRSDLYSLGAMLFQMLTGSPPYDGKSSAEIVGKHLADPVPVASDVNARIPRWLSDVMLRCLAKKPDERFQNAAAVLDALRAGQARGAGESDLVGLATVERKVRQASGAKSRIRATTLWVSGVLVGVLGLWWAGREGFVGRPLVLVQNGLVEPVEILRNGLPVDTIAPNRVVRMRLWRDGATPAHWRLIRPGNPPIGEAMEGDVTGPAPRFGRRTWHIEAQVGGQAYFAPLITNTTPSDITVEVNPRTQAAVRCNCLVPRGAVRAHIGYYRLYANSGLAAYNAAHPYAGPHADQTVQGSGVAASGAVVVTY